THPLSIAEIVLNIGTYIQTWVEQHPSHEQAMVFKPKDLVSAIAVNRLFRDTLTPFLWEVYAEPVVKVYADVLKADNYHRDTPLTFVRKKIHFIRRLDFSHFNGRIHRPLEQLQLLQHNCTRLQELVLSSTINIDWAGELIRANPELRVLHWTIPGIVHQMGGKDPYPTFQSLKYLFPHRHLQILRFEGWSWGLYPLHLFHILYNNAETLEELGLCKYTVFGNHRGPVMNADWSGLEDSFLAKMTEEERVEASQFFHEPRHPLILPKVKTLHLIMPLPETCTLFRALPALETLFVGAPLQNDVKVLRRLVREFCPHLKSIQNPDINSWNWDFIGYSELVVAILVGSCPVGNLVHLALNVLHIDNSLRDGILEHAGSLEVLELNTNSSHDWDEVFLNLGMVLERCGRLRKVSLFNFKRSCNVDDTKAVLQGLKSCRRLEHLTMVGYPYLTWDLQEKGGQRKVELIKAQFEAIEEPSPSTSEVMAAQRWKERKVYRNVVMPKEQLQPPTKKLRTLVFDALTELTDLRVVVLNEEWFERSTVCLS
ncbi:hypothetical protein BGZ96_003138, partial [Linnemannia gamsii]